MPGLILYPQVEETLTERCADGEVFSYTLTNKRNKKRLNDIFTDLLIHKRRVELNALWARWSSKSL